MTNFDEHDRVSDDAAASGNATSQRFFEEYFTAAVDRLRNRPELPGDTMPPAQNEAEKLDQEIQKLPKEVQEWLQKMADEIARTGKIPDELKKAFERGPGDKKGEIKLDWINRMLEKKGLNLRIELKSEGNLNTMELRQGDRPVDRHEFHRERGGKRQEKKDEDPDDDWDLVPPSRDDRRVT